MLETNNQQSSSLIKKILRKLKPKFSPHYFAYTALFFIAIFSVVQLVGAATPNPGHPWIELGDGVFTFTNGQTVTNRTYTFPNASTTVLTTNDLVTVAQGGTGVGTLASNGVLYGNGTGVVQALAVNAGAVQCLTQTSSAAPAWGSCASGGVAWSAITHPTTTQSLTFDDAELNAWTVSSDTETFQTITANSLTTGKVLSIASSSLTTGSLIDLAITGTAASVNQTGINISLSGANASAGVDTYGIKVSNTHTDGSSLAANTGVYASTTGQYGYSITGTNSGGGVGVSGAITSSTNFGAAALSGSVAGDGYGVQVTSARSASTGNSAITLESTTTGTFDTGGGVASSYAGYLSSTTTRSAGASDLTNVGLYATASGAQLNYAAIFDAGSVGIGDTTPDGTLDIDSSVTTGVNLGITNTGVYTGTGLLSVVANSATTGTIGLMTGNGLTSGNILSLTSSSASATTGQKGLNVALTGALTGAQTTYGGYFSNTRTGPSAVNVGLYSTASGATGANYAAIFDAGNVGIGTATPASKLFVADNTNALNTTFVIGKTNAYQDVRMQWQTTADTGTSFSGVARGMTLYATGHGSSGYAGWADYEGRPLIFYTGFDDAASVAERMRILGTGNVGIGGDTTPDSMLSVGSTSQFQVNSSGAIAASTGIISTNSIADTGSLVDLNLTLVNDAGADTVSALNIDVTSVATGVDGDSLYGINIANLTSADADVAESALFVGTGWDKILDTGALDISQAGIISGATGITSSGTITFSGLGGGGTLCVKTDNVGVLSAGACGGGASTLQGAYDGTSGNTILTTDARNIIFTLANVATPTSFTLENQDTAGVSAQRIFNSIASGTLTNGLLVENTDAGGTLTNAIQIAETAGTITDGILITGTLGNILNSGSIDITGGGAITGATGITSATGDITATAGNVVITAGVLTLNGTTRISNAGVGTFITGTVIGSQTFTTNSIVDSGALTISSGAGTALSLDSGTTGAINLATGNNAKTINIGTGTAGNTFNIGTDNTTLDTINIGSALDTTNINGKTTLTGQALSYLDLGLVVHNTTANQGLRLPNAASATPSNPTSGEGYLAWDAAGNQLITYNGSSWSTVGGGAPAWNSITAPTGNLTLAMDADTTTFNYDTLTTGTAFKLASSSISSGTLLDLTTTGTAALTGQKGLNISLSGANGTGAQTTYGAYLSNTKTGTSNNVGLYSTATGGSYNYAGIFEAGRVLIGTASETSSISNLYLTKALVNEDGSTGAGVAGIHEVFTMNPTSGTPTQVGNRLTIENATGSVASTQVGQIIRMDDDTSQVNTIRGIEVVASVGTNTSGTNTGIRATGKTFGVQGITIGTAGAVSAPAALYGETQGNTQGDALRLYSTTVTSSPQMQYIYHASSTFTGNAITLDMATGSGTFSGNFVDFQKNNASLFRVDDTGDTFVNLAVSTNSYGLCHETNGAGVDQIKDCVGGPTADYAEMYSVESGIEYGDIVVVGTEMINTYDTTPEGGGVDWNKVKGKITKLVKSNKSYQSNVIGIVSDNHNDFSSTGYNIKEIDNPMPVALVGRVPVKVTSDSDDIMPGDYLTTSDESGKATKAKKAGPVIGKALEVWTADSGASTVMVYVEQGFYNGVAVSQFAGIDPVANDFAKQVLKKFMNSQSADGGSELVLDRLAVGLEIITPKLVADEVATNIISAGTGNDIGLVLSSNGKFIIGGGKTTNPDGTGAVASPAITFDALGNATFAGKVTANEIDANSLAGIQDITDQINALSEGQVTFSLTTSVMNTLSGALTIAQADILKLQQDLGILQGTVEGLTLNGTDLDTRLKLVEAFITRDESGAPTGIATVGLSVSGDGTFTGKTQFEGLSFFSNTTSFAGGVNFNGQAEFALPPLYNKDSAGYALVKAGDRRAKIIFGEPYIATPVVNTSITFETEDNIDDAEASTLFGNDVRFIVTSKDQTGFTILLNKNAPRDIRFSWNALAVRDPSVFESVFEGLDFDPTPPADENNTPPPAGDENLPADEGQGGSGNEGDQNPPADNNPPADEGQGDSGSGGEQTDDTPPADENPPADGGSGEGDTSAGGDGAPPTDDGGTPPADDPAPTA